MFFKKLRRLFRLGDASDSLLPSHGSDNGEAAPPMSKTAQQNLTEGSWSQSAAASVAAYRRSPRFATLTRAVIGRSHPNFPWLSAIYSPRSRVPCCDLTPTFVALLNNGDRATIADILRHTLVANPGLGTGSGLEGASWIDRVVDQFADLDYHRYVMFATLDAVTRLRAFALVLSLKSGNGEFYLVDRTLELVTMALSLEEPRAKPAITALVERGNRFIQQMKDENVPFWLDYPLISLSHVLAPMSEAFPSRIDVEAVRSLPLLTRLVLLELYRRRAGTVEQVMTSALRVLGTDAAESLAILTEHCMVRIVEDPTITLMTRTKADLLEYAAKASIVCKPSHTKSRIIAAMVEGAPDLVARLTEHQPVYEVEPAYLETLNAWESYARHTMPLFEALAFAHAEQYRS